MEEKGSMEDAIPIPHTSDLPQGTLQMKKTSLILTIAIALLLSAFMTGCGGDEADVDTLHEDEANVDLNKEVDLHKDLVGTYDLRKAEFSGDGLELVLEPPKVAGTMTISSDQRIIQKLEGELGHDFRTGTFEILTDEGALLIKDDDVTFRVTYTWDGTILTITETVSDLVGKFFWRKLNNSVIDLQPPEPEPEPPLPPPAAFVSANPPSGSKIAANAAITLTFDNDPADITVNSGTVFGAGRTRSVVGPFPPGPLALTVTWIDGVVTLTYIVVAPDVEPPIVTGGTVRDGDKDVNSDAINNDGRIEITFSEDVTGIIALQTEAGDDVGWLGRVEGNKATLELVKGREIGNETTYVIKGRFSDAAGNEAEISITFVTRLKA